MVRREPFQHGIGGNGSVSGRRGLHRAGGRLGWAEDAGSVGERVRTSCSCTKASIARSGRAGRSSKINKWFGGLLDRQEMQQGHGTSWQPGDSFAEKAIPWLGWDRPGGVVSSMGRSMVADVELQGTVADALRPSAMPLRGSTTRPLRSAAAGDGPSLTPPKFPSINACM